MPDRQEHQSEVHRYLQKHLSDHFWTFSLPHGSGTETYFAKGNAHEYFVKVGASIERYQAMAEIGLTPPVLSCGKLESGQTIVVQSRIQGWTPSRKDFQEHWEEVARLLSTLHRNLTVRQALDPASSQKHRDAGRKAMDSLLQKWDNYKGLVPKQAVFVDKSLEQLALQLDRFTTDGLAACHNDICNANWIFASDGKIYIVDLESMSIEDPALDLGAVLWWYYPQELRQRFLDLAGYPYDENLRLRMRVRMAFHCLSILLPRKQSFDVFQPYRFGEALIDFKAVLDGNENPQAYV
jgi:thiamine kinase-like enzyme